MRFSWKFKWIIYSIQISWKTHENWYFSSKSWWNFVGISRTSSENVKICGELQRILKKLRQFGQNPETDEIIQYFKWIIQSCPERRLTGAHETAPIDKFSYGVANRGCSVRIPRDAEAQQCAELIHFILHLLTVGTCFFSRWKNQKCFRKYRRRYFQYCGTYMYWLLQGRS